MEKYSDGIIELINTEVYNNCSYSCFMNLTKAFNVLKDYEETGLTAEDFIDLKVCLEDEGDTGGTIRDLLELMKYRKMIEEGELIKLSDINEDLLLKLKSNIIEDDNTSISPDLTFEIISKFVEILKARNN